MQIVIVETNHHAACIKESYQQLIYKMRTRRKNASNRGSLAGQF